MSRAACPMSPGAPGAQLLSAVLVPCGRVWRELLVHLHRLNQIGIDEQLRGTNRAARSAAVRLAIDQAYRDRGACC